MHCPLSIAKAVPMQLFSSFCVKIYFAKLRKYYHERVFYWRSSAKKHFEMQ